MEAASLDVDRVEHLPYVPLVYIIAVDPSVAEEPTDECGILVCAATTEQDLYRRHFYIVEDATVLGSPRIWANQVVQKAREYGCPVVAEINQGGALVRDALQNIDPTIKVLDVRARYGKQTRAEPVSLAFEQHRGHMVGWHPDLESQLTSWTPSDRKCPGPAGRHGLGSHLAADQAAARPLHGPDPGPLRGAAAPSRAARPRRPFPPRFPRCRAGVPRRRLRTRVPWHIVGRN